MAKPFDELIDDLPAERRERIESHTQALLKEYELLKALRKDIDVSKKRWPR